MVIIKVLSSFVDVQDIRGGLRPRQAKEGFKVRPEGGKERAEKKEEELHKFLGLRNGMKLTICDLLYENLTYDAKIEF